MDNKCVCCGADIPEGRQYCPQCLLNEVNCRIISQRASRTEIERACIICGEGVLVYGFDISPKVCDKCRAAVMKVREQDG